MTQLPTTSFFFFFNDTATTEIYTLSLHDALPISTTIAVAWVRPIVLVSAAGTGASYQVSKNPVSEVWSQRPGFWRSEEHTSELQSLRHLVCRLLLEKKKRKTN